MVFRKDIVVVFTLFEKTTFIMTDFPPYLPEIRQGYKYDIEGTVYELTEIIISHAISNTDFIVCLCFKSETHFFQENVKRVLDNPIYKRVYEDKGV